MGQQHFGRGQLQGQGQGAMPDRCWLLGGEESGRTAIKHHKIRAEALAEN